MPRKKNNSRKLKGKGGYVPALAGRGLYARRIRGKGGFWSDLAKPFVGLASNAIDKVIPGSGNVARQAAKLFGVGAYRAGTMLQASPVPDVGRTEDSAVTYTHKEYLGDIYSSNDWETTVFPVNVGLKDTFPWLSGIAQSFQKYRVDSLCFYYRSRSSVAIASTGGAGSGLGMGTVTGVFQYNPYEKAPANKVEAMALSGVQACVSSQDCVFPLECDPRKNVMRNLLIRKDSVSDDLAKYDHANFVIATAGMPGSSYNMGELWVSYTVSLIAPKAEDLMPMFRSNPVNSLSTVDLVKTGLPSNLTLVAPTDTSILQSRNTLGIKRVVLGDGMPAIAFPSPNGYYRVNLDYSLTATGLSPAATFFFASPDASVTIGPAEGVMIDAMVTASPFTSGHYNMSLAFKLTCSLPVGHLRIGWQGPGASTWTSGLGDMEIVKYPDTYDVFWSQAATLTLAARKERALAALGVSTSSAMVASMANPALVSAARAPVYARDPIARTSSALSVQNLVSSEVWNGGSAVPGDASLVAPDHLPATEMEVV